MIPPSRPDLRPRDFLYLKTILKTRQVAHGPFVQVLESKAAEAVGRRYGVAVSSGTAALSLSLMAMGLRPGDEVLFPSYSCLAVYWAIVHAGAKAVPVDVDPGTLNPTPENVARRSTRKTKAMVLTHTFGFPARVSDFHGLPVVEDCSHALGATLDGHPVGCAGRASTFSLYATKMICAGEGGVVCTNAASTVARVRGLAFPEGRPRFGKPFNFKLSDLAAGLAVAQLRRLNEQLRVRRVLAKRYADAWGGAEGQRAVEGSCPSYFRYVIKVRNPIRVIRKARAQGIACDRPVTRPVHRWLGLPARHFPGTEEAWRRIVSVPLYPALTQTEIAKILRFLPEVPA